MIERFLLRYSQSEQEYSPNDDLPTRLECPKELAEEDALARPHVLDKRVSDKVLFMST
jgi:hypothetical protein